MTEDAWWALCDDAPEVFPWGVFADWLAECGDPREAAAREVVARSLAPRLVYNGEIYGTTWDWYTIRDRVSPDRHVWWGHSRVPREVLQAMPVSPQPSRPMTTIREYPTASDAYRALLTALAGTPWVEPAPAAAPGGMPAGFPGASGGR